MKQQRTDAPNTDVMDFPVALTVYLTLLTGLIGIASGCILASASLAVTGFLIALAGCALYGWTQRGN